MSYNPQHPCAQCGCYCEAHVRRAHRDYNQHRRRTGSNQSYGRQWRAIRDLYISAHPLCEQCIDAGRITPAQEVQGVGFRGSTVMLRRKRFFSCPSAECVVE